jgi:serine protease AprX
VRRGLLGIALIGLVGLSLSGSAAGERIGTLGFSVGALKAPLADRNGDKVFDDLAAKLETMDAEDTLSVIVRVKGDLTQARADSIEGSVGGFDLTHWLPIVDGFAATVTKSQVEALAGLESVRQVELNGVVHAMNDSAQASFGVTRARADDPALDGNRDGSASYSKNDIVVAVIDTGIAANHEQLDDGKVIGFANCLNETSPDDCSTPAPFDDNGHGTHVAGTIAGDGEGHPQFKGAAPGAALVGVKVLAANGTGSSAGVTSGIQWAVQHKADFGIRAINLSLGGGTCSAGIDAESDAVNAATAAGIAVFVAAGNDGPDRCTIGSPGAASTAITVGAMADLGVPLERNPVTGSMRAREPGFNLASFSSRGPTSLGAVKPDVAGPGVHVTSAEAGTVAGYVTFQGTSMATPFVAGVGALMLDDDPTLTPAQIKTTLRNTAIDWGLGGEFHVPGSSGPDVDYGAGRLDAFAAIKAVDGNLGSPPATPEHVVLSGSLPGTGTFQDFPIVVNTTTFPLAVTLIMTGWVGPDSPDFDLRFFGPNGFEIGVPGLYSDRQEEMGVLPAQTGVYKIRVESFIGGGDFIIDVSGGSPPPTPPLPPPPAPQPPPPAPQPPPAAPPPPPPAPKPIKCKVPNVKGKTVPQARAALKAKKCRLGAVTKAFSGKVKKGRVISQTRRPGRVLPRNTAVGVKISKGARKK